jgi:hypothetical protein
MLCLRLLHNKSKEGPETQHYAEEQNRSRISGSWEWNAYRNKIDDAAGVPLFPNSASINQNQLSRFNAVISNKPA